MRRAVVLALSGAVLVGSLSAAPPALAQGVKECLDREITFNTTTVRLEGVNVVIDPNGVPTDVEAAIALAGQIVDLAMCIEGDTTAPADCVVGLALEIALSLDPNNGDLRYVTRDPDTGVVVIHTDRVLLDLGRCL